MKNKVLAIHYHSIVGLKNNRLTTDFFTGMWVESLSKNFSKIFVIAFTDRNNYSFEYISSNIQLIDLGKKPTKLKDFYLKLPKYYKILKKYNSCFDYLGIRMPTPLGICISFIFRSTPKFFLIIGSMPDVVKCSDTSITKKIILYVFWKIDQILYRFFKDDTLFLGNNKNYKKTFPYIKNMKIIPTSTINKNDIINKPRSLNQNFLRLIFIGRIDDEKGLNYLIEAISMLQKQKVNLNLKIVGVKKDGKKRMLENFINKYGVEHIIELIPFTTKRKDIFNYLDNSDLLIIPSIWDSQPRVAWEAMARGLPVLASKGVQSLQDESLGILKFKSKSSQSIYNTILHLISSKNKYTELSKGSLQLVKSKTLEKSAEMFLKELNLETNK